MVASRREWLILACTAAIAGTGGFIWRFASKPTTSFDTPKLGADSTRSLENAVFSDLVGRQRSLREWHGSYLLCNFWATWCPPCIEEIPLLQRTSHKYQGLGLKVVGIALDNVEKVGVFARKMGIEYPILVGGAETLTLIRELGNTSGGLPFTLLLDPKGRLLQQKIGAMDQAEIDHMIQPALTHTKRG